MPGSPVNSVAPVELLRERGDRVRAREPERLGRGKQVVVRRRVADVLAAPLVAAAAHHDRGRDALEAARDRLRRPLVRDVVDEHGQRRDAVKGSHGPSCYAAMPAGRPTPRASGSRPRRPRRSPTAVRRAGGELVPASEANVDRLVRLRASPARAGPARALAAARRRSAGCNSTRPASSRGSSTASWIARACGRRRRAPMPSRSPSTSWRCCWPPRSACPSARGRRPG